MHLPRHGHSTQVAAKLGVTLGALSRQIKSLKTDLGVAIFKRHHRCVELTKAEHFCLYLLRENICQLEAYRPSKPKSC